MFSWHTCRNTGLVQTGLYLQENALAAGHRPTKKFFYSQRTYKYFIISVLGPSDLKVTLRREKEMFIFANSRMTSAVTGNRSKKRKIDIYLSRGFEKQPEIRLRLKVPWLWRNKSFPDSEPQLWGWQGWLSVKRSWVLLLLLKLF